MEQSELEQTAVVARGQKLQVVTPANHLGVLTLSVALSDSAKAARASWRAGLGKTWRTNDFSLFEGVHELHDTGQLTME